MTEFKNDLISKILDKLDNELFDYLNANCGSCLYPSIVEQIVFGILKEELKDVMVVDRNKFKEKISVKVIPPSFDNYYANPLCYKFASGVHSVKYVDELTYESLGEDVIKNHFKDEFIAHLEECDF